MMSVIDKVLEKLEGTAEAAGIYRQPSKSNPVSKLVRNANSALGSISHLRKFLKSPVSEVHTKMYGFLCTVLLVKNKLHTQSRSKPNIINSIT